MSQKQATVDALGHGIEYLFRKYKVVRVNGWAEFAAPGLVDVKQANSSKVPLNSHHVVIASGSIPSTLPNVQVDQRKIVDSTGALSLQEVPRRLLVIGGGSIGLELGSIWRRLGAQVEVIEYLDRVAPGTDDAVSSALQRLLEKQGFKFHLSTEVIEARVTGDTVSVSVRSRATDDASTIEADVVLVAVGRRPFTGALGLEKIGLRPDARGFITTRAFQTDVPGVWAIGDVAGGAMLAHKAGDEGVACVEKLAGRPGQVDYDIIPSVIYTSPEVAWVGQTEGQVKASGQPYKVGRFPFSANSRAKTGP
jgi:dihydrolipoamide dehydrogenase